MTFLFIDDNRIVARDREYAPMLEVSFWQGVKLLLQFRKYHLHGTMGRSIIMQRHSWKKLVLNSKGEK